MIKIPQDAKKMILEDSSVEFYNFTLNEVEYFYFDTSLCSAPEPMVNALLGLQLLKKKSQRLIMVNHHAPGGLFPRIAEDFTYDILTLDTGVQVVFALKNDLSQNTDFNDNSCAG